MGKLDNSSTKEEAEPILQEDKDRLLNSKILSIDKKNFNEYFLKVCSDSNSEKNINDVDNIINNNSNSSKEIEKQSHFSYDPHREALKALQKKRVECETDILENYKIQQNKRQTDRQDLKPKLFNFVKILIFTILICFYLCIYNIIIADFDVGKLLAGIIPCCITILSSIISIFIIIVKYIFPEDEETNFNDLVKTIIQTDTERMKNDDDYDCNNKKHF